MPKKAARSTKRAKRRPARKSFLEKLFTFPKLVVFGILILGSLTIYQITLSSNQVKGVTTVDEDISYSRDEAIANVKKQAAAGVTVDRYIAIKLFRDVNKNADQDGSEDCAKKSFTVKKNGKEKTATQDDCNYPARYLKVTKNCNTIAFVRTNTSNKFAYTGMYVTDNNNRSGKAFKGVKSKVVCGFPKSEGGDGWGFYYNQVEFGVKEIN